MKNKKPLGYKSYGSIAHLSNSLLGAGDHFIHEGQERILTEKARDKHDRIIVTEKYDGSNVSIAKLNGKIIALSRAGYEAKTSPYKQHHVFSDWVDKNANRFIPMLRDGERISGEWMYQAHGLRYQITQDDPIIFFDMFDENNKRHSHDFFMMSCALAGILHARVIHDGNPVKTSDIISKLNNYKSPVKSIGKPEGMVYRVERKGVFDFMAKWVRSDFIPGRYIINKSEDDFIYNKC